ncbi:MAG: NAD-dependent epimerase/dehydratase family protein [Solobacterium sp.]|nr:NAD-dependent epimerase/dehydratase family protein [Solobacterium sp.]
MKILVIGGTRFFGIPMVEKLLEAGHDVTIATRGRNSDPFEDRAARMILDRNDAESVKRTAGTETWDLIIDKVAYASNDVRSLLENVKCRRYIQMSSCAVYRSEHADIREAEYDPAREPLIWMSRSEDYALGKRQAERAALEYLKPEQCVFVRYPVVLGEHDYTKRLRFYIDHVREGKPMQIDDPEAQMSFIHEKEAGEFLAFLADHPLSGAVNGSCCGTISTAEIIREAERMYGRQALMQETGDPAPYNGSHGTVTYNTEKAEAAGFRFSNLHAWIHDLIRTDREI